jgi:hypothetical protein
MVAQRLLVLSDTHGDAYVLEIVLNWAQDFPKSGGINAAVFLGDGISDLPRCASGFSCEWKLVRGNNDFDFALPLSDVFDFGGHRFYFCHGHRASLYSGFFNLVAAAKNNNADVALFGHTHVPYHKNVDGILLVNPGSLSRPRSDAGATFAVIQCEPGKPLQVEFWELGSRGKIKRLTEEKLGIL